MDLLLLFFQLIKRLIRGTLLILELLILFVYVISRALVFKGYHAHEFLHLQNTINDPFSLEDAFWTQLVNLAGEIQVVDYFGEYQEYVWQGVSCYFINTLIKPLFIHTFVGLTSATRTSTTQLPLYINTPVYKHFAKHTTNVEKS